MAACAIGTFPRHHLLAVRAAEISGRVPLMLRALAEEEDARRKARAELISRSLYPILLFHVAAVAPNAGLAVTDLAAFATAVLSILIPVDLLLGLAGYFLFSTRVTRLGARLILRVPLFAGFVLARDYLAYFTALHHLYEAGLPLSTAADEALQGLQNPVLESRLNTALEPLRRNQPLALAVASFPDLKEEIRAMLITSEPAGELGPALASAVTYCAEDLAIARRRLQRVAAAALLTIAFTYAGVRVIGFWANYYNALAGF